MFGRLRRLYRMPAPPRVLVVDDHPIVLEGVRNALAPLPATVEVAIDPETAISMLEEREFDLAILDISFRNSNLTGYDILRSCRRAHPHLPVLMASVFDDEWIQDAAWREGASGFISKGKADSVWREAARALLGGGTSFHFLPRKKARSQGLTPTELEVAHCWQMG